MAEIRTVTSVIHFRGEREGARRQTTSAHGPHGAIHRAVARRGYATLCRVPPSPRPLCTLAIALVIACTATGGDDTTATTTSASTTETTPADTTTPTSTDTLSTSTSTSTSTGDIDDTTTTTTTTTTITSTTDPDEPVPDCAVAPCFNVMNNCSTPLWIHAANNADVVLAPDNVLLAPGETQQYPVPPEWPAGRVNAYYQDPSDAPEAHDKVEVTVTGGIMNYNITYVDYVSLPAEMVAVGPECQPTDEFDPKIGCYVPRAELLDGCPGDLRSGDRCLSAGLYCSDPAHQEDPYCHALDAEIAACAAQHPDTCGVAMQLGDSTRDVYSCSGYFDSQPPNCMPASPDCHAEGNKWCAALNRGMLADPESTDTADYYQKPPFNTYARWVHDTCPGIYAFAYDDYPSNAGESGFRACKADRLDITFCPSG
jgi:hypothetical protein